MWGFVWEAYDGTYPSTYELVPMLVWDQNLPSAATVQSIAAKTDHDYWLVFNECENQNQCNHTPEIQAQFYYNFVLPLINANDPDAKLIIGGSSAHPCGLAWMTRFVETYLSLYGQDPPRAGWHFHVYPEVVPLGWQPGEICPSFWAGVPSNTADIQHVIADFERFRLWWSRYGSPDDEIWLTEIGCLVPSDYEPWCPRPGSHANMVEYMGAITAYLNNEGRWVNRYAWYTDRYEPYPYDMTWLFDATSPSANHTAIGSYYAQIQPSSHVPGFLYYSFLPVGLNDGSSTLALPPGPEASPAAYPAPGQSNELPYP